MILYALAVFGTCHLLIALLLTWNRLRTPALRDAPPLPAPPPSVLVVIPARNEEANIGDCVRSVLAQRYERLRVRVVDDHSTDGTAAQVRALCEGPSGDRRLELMAAPDLPPGWLGKPHALHAGTRDAAADYLLFLDADMRLAPEALGKAVAAAAGAGAGLLTVVPRLLVEGFWERAVQPVVASLLFALLDPVRVRDPRSAFASANGPFLLFRRDAYERIGGHAAVAGEVVEDLRLAQLVKRAGLGLAYLHGVDLCEIRMYDSLRAIMAGWSKNFHVALGKAQVLAPLGSLLIALCFGLPAVGLWAGVLLRDPALCLIGGLSYGADLLGRLSLSWNYGVRFGGMRTLGGLMVAYILSRSAYRSARGQKVMWRGRPV